jgi:DNA-binding NarL/FixJ family response regulator
VRRTSVLIVDDNFVARRGLRSFLESEADISVTGEASTGAEAIRWVRASAADVILMDIRMPDMDGLEATSAILKARPESKVLMLTVMEDPAILVRTLLLGAKGYLVYGHFTPEVLAQSIRMVAGGGSVMTPAIQNSMLGSLDGKSTALSDDNEDDAWMREELTAREEEILQFIALGKGNREIAKTLFIEEKTVKNHINNIYSKLHLESRHAAIVYSLRYAKPKRFTPVRN